MRKSHKKKEAVMGIVLAPKKRERDPQNGELPISKWSGMGPGEEPLLTFWSSSKKKKCIHIFDLVCIYKHICLYWKRKKSFQKQKLRQMSRAFTFYFDIDHIRKCWLWLTEVTSRITIGRSCLQFLKTVTSTSLESTTFGNPFLAYDSHRLYGKTSWMIQ